MKKIFKWAGMLSLILVLGAGSFAPQAKAQPGISVSINTFYDQLRPYGTWRQDAVYGQVWQPRAEKDFRPYYTRGHWVMTDAGNTWASEYDWGWAPFHYGRWVERRSVGWIWVPGTEWAPAWVSWRSGGDDYGWAPLTPEVNINVQIGGGNGRYTEDYYDNGYSSGGYDYAADAYQDVIPASYWVFVPRVQIFRPDFYRYNRGPRYNTTIIRNTTIINNVNIYNNVRYSYGPRREELQRYLGKPVKVYKLRNNNRPGRVNIQNNTVNIYRPNIKITNNNRFAKNKYLNTRAANKNAMARAEKVRRATAKGNAQVRNNNNVQVRNNRKVPNPNVQQWTGNRKEQLQKQRAAAVRQKQNAAQQKADVRNKANVAAQASRTNAQKQQEAQAQRNQAAQQQKQRAQAQKAEVVQQKREREQVQAQRRASVQQAKQPKQVQAPKRNEAAQQQRQNEAAQRQRQNEAAQQQKQQVQTQRANQRKEAVQQQRQKAQVQRANQQKKEPGQERPERRK